MRYSRNIKIFRGGVDAAPFASLFFLIVLFMLLFYSHVFFPGVPIQLGEAEEPPEMTTRTARVFASGTVDFLGKNYDLTELKAELQSRMQKGTLPKRLLFETEPQTNAKLAAQVETLLKGSGIALKLPGTRNELPDDAGFAGGRNPVVVVGINLNGQLFFEHRLVSEALLQQKLASAAAQSPEPLTLLLQADKNVPADRIVRLSRIATRAKISAMRIATKPAAGS